MWWFGDGDEEDQRPSAPKTVQIEVYRLADLAAGVAAFRTLRARPDWTRWSTEGLVDTKALDRVVAFDAPFNPNGDAFWVQLPEALPAGWYLVQQPDGTRPSQIVLQVTDVAGYLRRLDDPNPRVGQRPRHRPTDRRRERRERPRTGRTNGCRRACHRRHPRRSAPEAARIVHPPMRSGRHRAHDRWSGDLPPGGIAERQAGRLRGFVLLVRGRPGLLEPPPHRPGRIPNDGHGQSVGRHPRPGHRGGPVASPCAPVVAGRRRRICPPARRGPGRQPRTDRILHRLAGLRGPVRRFVLGRSVRRRQARAIVVPVRHAAHQADLSTGRHHRSSRLRRRRPDQGDRRSRLLRGNAGRRCPPQDRWLRRTQRHDGCHRDGRLSNGREGRQEPGRPQLGLLRCRDGSRRGGGDHRGESRIRHLPEPSHRRWRGPDRGRQGPRQR